MKKNIYNEGIIIGKFMPLHKGHIALIEFGTKHAKLVNVLVCGHPGQPIEGTLRYQWTRDYFADNPKVMVHYLDCKGMPDKEEADREVSKFWAEFLKKKFPHVDVIFSSERYGDFVAEYMQINHVSFDESRRIQQVSGTKIRNDPFTYREFLPKNVQPYFVKKVCIVGAESTGKSTLTKLLATHYNTTYVHEVGRELCPDNAICTDILLMKIAEEHARLIEQKTLEANKLLFVDTDVNITRSYGRFLLKVELEIPKWIEDTNRSDLYIYLDTDCDLIQDGGRLPSKELRNILASSHRKALDEKGIKYHIVSGTRGERLERSIELVDSIIPGGETLGSALNLNKVEISHTSDLL